MGKNSFFQPPMWVQILIVLFILMAITVGECVSKLEDAGSGHYEPQELSGCEGGCERNQGCK